MKKVVMLLLAVMAMLLMTGCGKEQAKEAPPAGGQPVTIGMMPDVDSIPFIIAQEKGFFKEEGVTVVLTPFKSAMDRDSALQSGKLDGAVSDMLAVAFQKNGGFDVMITSLTSGSYKLVLNANETATSLQGLQGKDVALSKNTIIEYVTDRVLASGGLSPAAINKVYIPQIPTRLEMLQNGKIAAATLPEPLASVAVKNGGKVLNSSDQLGINPGVMMFTTKAVSGKEKEMQAMYRAYNKAIDYLAREPVDNYIDLLIEKGGFPPSVKGVLVLPKYHKAAAPQAKDIDECLQWLKEHQLIQTSYTAKELVDDRFVR